MLSMETEDGVRRRGGCERVGLDVRKFVKALLKIVNGNEEAGDFVDEGEWDDEEEGEDDEEENEEGEVYIHPESILLAVRWYFSSPSLFILKPIKSNGGTPSNP
jgi:hypothetical protein